MDLAKVVVYPLLAAVEYERKTITKTSWKSCGISSYHHINTAHIAPNMFVIHKMNPVAYRCKLLGFLSVPRCAIISAKVDSLLIRTNCGVQQPQSHDCQILLRQCSSEKKSVHV